MRINSEFKVILIRCAVTSPYELDLRMLNMKTNSRYHQVVILAGLHVVSRDFSDEFPYSSGRVIHKVSVNCNSFHRDINVFS